MTIAWSPNDDVIEAVWRGFASHQAYRFPLEKLLELVTSKQTTKLLVNMRNLGVISQADQQWTETDYIPRLIATGITHMALVIPTSVLGQMYLQKMVHNVEKDHELPYELFNTADIEQARGWLKGQS